MSLEHITSGNPAPKTFQCRELPLSSGDWYANQMLVICVHLQTLIAAPISDNQVLQLCGQLLAHTPKEDFLGTGYTLGIMNCFIQILRFAGMTILESLPNCNLCKRL